MNHSIGREIASYDIFNTYSLGLFRIKLCNFWFKKFMELRQGITMLFHLSVFSMPNLYVFIIIILATGGRRYKNKSILKSIGYA